MYISPFLHYWFCLKMCLLFNLRFLSVSSVRSNYMFSRQTGSVWNVTHIYSGCPFVKGGDVSVDRMNGLTLIISCVASWIRLLSFKQSIAGLNSTTPWSQRLRHRRLTFNAWPNYDSYAPFIRTDKCRWSRVKQCAHFQNPCHMHDRLFIC